MNTNMKEKAVSVYYETILKLCLFDDTFARCVFKDMKCSELLISAVLDQKVKIKKLMTQYDMKNLYGRSAIADIYAVLEDDTFVIVEIERNRSRAHPKRAAYCLSLLNSMANKAGDKNWSEMANVIVIVIYEGDYFKNNQHTYISRQTLQGLNKPLGDQAEIIYVNGALQDNSPVGRLMHDFACVNYQDMYYKELRDCVCYYKTSRKGVDKMCKIVEDECKKAEKRGEKRGERRGEKRGERRGRDKEKRALLINLLKQKLGKLSKKVIVEINNSNDNHLNELSIHIFDVNNEQDVLNILAN